MLKTSTLACLLVLSVFATAPVLSGEVIEWKEQFETICSQTTAAASLSAGQLQKLVNESDELLARLKLLEEPSVKVYIFRLEKCRDLFQFMLDWQQQTQTDNTG